MNLPQDTTATGTKRKESQKDETLLQVRVLPPASSSMFSTQPTDVTTNPSFRLMKQAKTVGKGLNMLAHCEHERNGSLQVRMVGARPSAKEKALNKKDGEHNLHSWSCPPIVQADRREMRHPEWKRWKSCNTGRVFLTDEEVSQLTESCCEMYVVQKGRSR